MVACLPPVVIAVARSDAGGAFADTDGNKHYFYLVSPDPSYPYWIKIREA